MRGRAGVVLVLAAILASATAIAQDNGELKIDTPSINTIKKSLADRMQLMRSLFDSGVVGITHDGMVALRDARALEANVQRVVDGWIIDDNKDRETLLREIARANGRSDWESTLRGAFAERWRARAPAGWWLRDSGGNWTKKP